MAIAAAERRLKAIRDLTDIYVDGMGQLTPKATTGRVISDIDRLRHLGRTDRWLAALDKWERMVREHPEDLDWAVLQGAIYCGYAAL